MKPSYNIGLRNGILEGKHMDALGSAIWLYMWFLDKQPKDNNKVLGGQPVTYKMFAQLFPDVPRIKYVRWLSVIEAGGYVKLLRTPRGYVVTITKPKKWLKSDVSSVIHRKDIEQPENESDVSKTEHHRSDVSPVQHHEPVSEQNLGSDVSKLIHLEDVSKMNIQYKRDSLNKQLTTNNSTNVELGEPPPTFGKVEINEMFAYWQQIVGYPILDNCQKNRNACNNLLKRYKTEGLKRIIGYVNMAHADQFGGSAAKISDFVQLQARQSDMNVWLKTKSLAKPKGKIYEI